MYIARFLKTFLRQEKKLNANTKERLIKAVKEILNNPYSGINLKGDLREYWKKRVGKYRIIYKISESEKNSNFFFDVNLRKKVYNRLKRR